MQAQLIQRFGAPSVFNLINIPVPEIKPGHVLLQVHATSVNPIDLKIRSGAVPEIAPDFPALLHGDVAGIVVEVGEGVTHFKTGDEIYGCAGGLRGLEGGALAEFMLADANLIAKKPNSLSMREAAALPLVGITAWLALFEKVQLKKGMEILIHGGVGGVGHIAVQLAKWCGATVYTTVRAQDDFSTALAFGADEVINAQAETVEDYKSRLSNNLGFACIFDTVGGANLDNSFAAAALNGAIVTIAARSSHDLTPLHNKGLSLHCVLSLLPLLTQQQRETYKIILEKVAEIVDAGKLKPLLDPHRFSLIDVAQAHELLESGKAKGKVVISIID